MQTSHDEERARVYRHHNLGFRVCIKIQHFQRLRSSVLEALLLDDMATFLEKIFPRDHNYQHNNFEIRTVNMNDDESPNGHAHLQHLLLGTSETVPVIDGEVQFGTYQSVFFIELDHPRPREVMVHVIGE